MNARFNLMRDFQAAFTPDVHVYTYVVAFGADHV